MIPPEQNYLQIWYDNMTNNRPTNQILILGYDDKNDDKKKGKSEDFEKSIKEYFSKFESFLYIDKITKIDKKVIEDNKNKNILAYTTSNINFNWLDNFKNINYDFIFVQINKIEDIYNMRNIPLVSTYYLSKLEPFTVLSNFRMLEYFISIFIDSKPNFIFRFTQNSIREYLYRGKYSINIDRIKNDIDYYYATSFLTSRLAIFIYKICNFEPSASDKNIGEYYAKEFGKSITLNNKKFSISNTKGYPTKQFNYQDRYTLREEIAKKLADRNVAADIIYFATNIDVNKFRS